MLSRTHTVLQTWPSIYQVETSVGTIIKWSIEYLHFQKKIFPVNLMLANSW